jgi:ParB family transcriptional regulator, chromosome partitioning protein
MMASTKNRGLGRGLEALIVDTEIPVVEPASGPTKDGVAYIDINDIKPNRNQPRKRFDADRLQELADSISEHGVIQPLIVRLAENGYELVAGERRWRAARLAGLKSVPCLLRELTEEENALVAIIENMQREDLNPVEEAEGLNRMIDNFGLTQEQVSKSVGKSRPYITNSLRLLKLPAEIKEMLSQGTLSAGHGRALLAVHQEKEQLTIAHKIVNEGLSVRVVEGMVQKKQGAKAPAHKHAERDANTLQMERELKELLGTKVKINMSGKKGKIEIEYYSREELERLIELLRSL